ncbi:MAG: hypothetical protein M3O65_10140 [Actinomycetota bacterium]|nr:hypothetical protein [Actinomycetota bacterium]
MLAAVEGPSDSPSQHQDASKQCPGDDEDGWAAEDDPDHEPDEGVEEDDEEDEGERGEKEGEEMEEGEDPEDQEDRTPGRAGGQIGLEWPPAANPQPPSPPQQLPPAPQPPSIHQPPATHQPAGDAGSGPGDEVLGS